MFYLILIYHLFKAFLRILNIDQHYIILYLNYEFIHLIKIIKKIFYFVILFKIIFNHIHNLFIFKNLDYLKYK